MAVLVVKQAAISVALMNSLSLSVNQQARANYGQQDRLVSPTATGSEVPLEPRHTGWSASTAATGAKLSAPALKTEHRKKEKKQESHTQPQMQKVGTVIDCWQVCGFIKLWTQAQFYLQHQVFIYHCTAGGSVQPHTHHNIPPPYRL